MTADELERLAKLEGTDKDSGLPMITMALHIHRHDFVRLIRAAEKMAVHRQCEDSWYSCPKSEEGCANEFEGEECNCGADELIEALAPFKE